MKIKEGGFTVTDLPAVGTIHVEPDGGDSFRIVMCDVDFTPDQWREFTEACVYVRDRLAGVVPNASGPWERAEDIPAGVDAVRDREGDKWIRREWEDDSRLANRYGPFRPA